MNRIEITNVSKKFGSALVLDQINLTADEGEFLVLVGASGCGKSTLLRLIAGLETPDTGSISIDGKSMLDTSPSQRDVAMVFQNYALYPHLSVYDNMAFGLRQKKVPETVIDTKIRETGEILQIEQLFERKPKALSGGQRQRVALGRAMVRDPKVFLSSFRTPVQPTNYFRYCAAGATSSECKRGRRRRSSLKSLLRESIGWLRTHFFELLARGEPFSRSKTGTREAPIAPKSCPLLLLMSAKNNRALLDQVDGAGHRKYTKNSLKNRLL